jgi:hypothetical protein
LDCYIARFVETTVVLHYAYDHYCQGGAVGNLFHIFILKQIRFCFVSIFHFLLKMRIRQTGVGKVLYGTAPGPMVFGMALLYGLFLGNYCPFLYGGPFPAMEASSCFFQHRGI